MTHIFVNIPTSDLERSKAFYTALGASLNPTFTDDNAACIVWDDNVYFMAVTNEYFATFTDKKTVDPRTHAQVLIALSRESRAAVDEIIAAGVAAGGSEPTEPKGLRLHVQPRPRRPRRQRRRVLLHGAGGRRPGSRRLPGGAGEGVSGVPQLRAVLRGHDRRRADRGAVGRCSSSAICSSALAVTRPQAGTAQDPTNNILSTRLKELQESGVVRRVPLLHCGLVYELTPYGRELEPIVLALGRWGFAQMGDPQPDDVVTVDSLTIALRTAFRVDAATSRPSGRLRAARRRHRAACAGVG
ncbi:winged helix-turn-helix transcriptional regulator [Microbacterium kyungheense]|uniref:winged helix-turn-helix transcriptional regulator n=1 Tax=Microbacterium kyungheense TaxID=1263636 RepID=UPI003CCC818B